MLEADEDAERYVVQMWPAPPTSAQIVASTSPWSQYWTFPRPTTCLTSWPTNQTPAAWFRSSTAHRPITRHAGAEVQVDTLPAGELPALVETDRGRHQASTAEAATSLILACLGLEDT